MSSDPGVDMPQQYEQEVMQHTDEMLVLLGENASLRAELDATNARIAELEAYKAGIEALPVGRYLRCDVWPGDVARNGRFISAEGGVMTTPEIRKLAEDYLTLPPGPYRITPSSQESEQYWIVVGRDGKGGEIDYFEGWRAQAEAEAHRLNVMPRLLRAAFNVAFTGQCDDVRRRPRGMSELVVLITRCEAHQKGEPHA